MCSEDGITLFTFRCYIKKNGEKRVSRKYGEVRIERAVFVKFYFLLVLAALARELYSR